MSRSFLPKAYHLSELGGGEHLPIPQRFDPDNYRVIHTAFAQLLMDIDASPISQNRKQSLLQTVIQLWDWYGRRRGEDVTVSMTRRGPNKGLSTDVQAVALPHDQHGETLRELPHTEDLDPADRRRIKALRGN